MTMNMIMKSPQKKALNKFYFKYPDGFLFRCLIEENELRELNRRQLIRIELLECDYRQLDDDLAQLQIERDLLLKQKRM